MNAYQEKLGRIRNKIQSLAKHCQQMEKENSRLRDELNKNQTLLDNSQKQNSRLEQQLNVLRAASGQMDESGKKKLEKQLNLYIREIDRCIAMMNE